MREILLAHALRYPRMQPTDAVKLLYQNEFGGGHLIRDPEACLRYLSREYAETKKDPQCPLYEDIGGGMIRVHLAALPEEDLPRLGEAFLRSAREHQGTLESFLTKLELLRQITAEGVFAFDASQLEQYLTVYAQSGYPMVSHSPQYRDNYHPAYRVVKKELFL